MQFGKAVGMVTVFIGDAAKLDEADKKAVDIYCESLSELAAALSEE
jgi:hypothetical protein